MGTFSAAVLFMFAARFAEGHRREPVFRPLSAGADAGRGAIISEAPDISEEKEEQGSALAEQESNVSAHWAAPSPGFGEWCFKGVKKNATCCAKSCGSCGGSGCGSRPGGGSKCCQGNIKKTCESEGDVACNVEGPCLDAASLKECTEWARSSKNENGCIAYANGAKGSYDCHGCGELSRDYGCGLMECLAYCKDLYSKGSHQDSCEEGCEKAADLKQKQVLNAMRPEDRAYEMLGLINNLRAEGFTCAHSGETFAPILVPLKWDCRLWKAARLHSEDMAVNGFFAHQNLQGQHQTTRGKKQGLSMWNPGENLAAGNADAESTLRQWLGSTTGHCELLGMTRFKVMGVGYAEGGHYGHYWTLNVASDPDLKTRDSSCLVEAPKLCANWCHGASTPWEKKCGWKNCNGCVECDPEGSALAEQLVHGGSQNDEAEDEGEDIPEDGEIRLVDPMWSQGSPATTDDAADSFTEEDEEENQEEEDEKEDEEQEEGEEAADAVE